MSNEPVPSEFSRTISFGNVSYSLYSHSFLHFGQVRLLFVCNICLWNKFHRLTLVSISCILSFGNVPDAINFWHLVECCT